MFESVAEHRKKLAERINYGEIPRKSGKFWDKF